MRVPEAAIARQRALAGCCYLFYIQVFEKHVILTKGCLAVTWILNIYDMRSNTKMSIVLEANRVASSTRTESRRPFTCARWNGQFTLQLERCYGRMQEWMDRVIAKETAQHLWQATRRFFRSPKQNGTRKLFTVALLSRASRPYTEYVTFFYFFSGQALWACSVVLRN